MRRLRAGLIGSIRAWLPSRRSTAHHIGAWSTTRSGQVRSASVTGSTSSANVRYRLTGIDVVRWVFQAGCPGLGAPAGLLMVRADEKASGESGAGLENVVTMVAPGVWGGTSKGRDRRIATTRDGKPVWIRPRRGCREGAPAAPDNCSKLRAAPQTALIQRVGRSLLARCRHHSRVNGWRLPDDRYAVWSGSPQRRANATSSSGNRMRGWVSRSMTVGSAFV